MGSIATDRDAIDVTKLRGRAWPATTPEQTGVPLAVLGPGKDAQTVLVADKWGMITRKAMTPEYRKALGQSTAEFVHNVSMERLKADARKLLAKEIRKDNNKKTA